MTQSQAIALAFPIFLVLMAAEFLVGLRRGHNTYRLNDAVGSLGAGLLSEVAKLFTRLLVVAVYSACFESLALWRLDPTSPWVWLVALVGYDFLYYWQHRAGHRVAVLWAAHSVHHQSEDFNLSTALRQSSTGFLLNWVFYLPLAVLGVPPMVFAMVALIDLLYQFWVHTQHIGRLGAFDRWFCAPSNHRVHHAVNDRYVDRNYGGILMIWDRMFGTYAEEDDAEPCVYGTRAPLRSFNPLWANLQIYRDLLLDSWRTQRAVDKLRVWVMPPGWRPADVAQRWPREPFDLAQVRRHDPSVGPVMKGLSVMALLVALALTTWLMWTRPERSLLEQVMLALGAAALLGAGGACLGGSAGPLHRQRAKTPA